MNSRMEKYENNENQVTSRTEKNKKLYDDTNIDRIDVGYIDIDKSNVFEIPLAKEKDIKTREDYARGRMGSKISMNEIGLGGPV